MAKGFSVTINRKQLLDKQRKAFAEANEIDMQEAIIGEIISPVWDWNGTTYRRNGEVVGSPRNIVDEGTLLEGYQKPQKRGSNGYAHVFTAEHTLAVHSGAVYTDNRTMEPRPFTQRPVENFPEMFAKRYRELP